MALDWMADVLHDWQTGLEDAAIGRLSPLLCPPNVLAQALDSVRQALHRGWGLTPALQGGNGWRAYQESRMEATLAIGNVRLLIHLPIYSVFPMPLATSKKESVSHSYAGFSPYLEISPDRQLFVEFNVDEARKCAPYKGSVCQFLKPSDQKERMKSCTAAVFLQEQEGIQRNCCLDSKKWTGIILFYIGGRKWGYAVLQCPRERIGKIGLTKVLPSAGVIKMSRLCSLISDECSASELPTNAASELNERHRRGSCRDAERPTSAGGGAIATGDEEPNY
ncbi:hypothetical protein OUZ56_003734 [Daphnia magna]|uniref:Uncharacterized protein n=1 Tax=Daphnia magna TaxID=35525 RepID=A0ABR0A9L1_9CRUS|nr:hypothetical protein OUZ56_003734 [Daphnia magna]